MISFDVAPLFTVIPVDAACENIRNKLSKDNTFRQRSKLSIGDIELLRFTLSSRHFNYNIKTYKQTHGCTVGSPVSPIVVKHCMKKIEELAFYGTDTLPKNIFGRAREETRKKNRICAITRRARTCIF